MRSFAKMTVISLYNSAMHLAESRYISQNRDACRKNRADFCKIALQALSVAQPRSVELYHADVRIPRMRPAGQRGGLQHREGEGAGLAEQRGVLRPRAQRGAELPAAHRGSEHARPWTVAR